MRASLKLFTIILVMLCFSAGVHGQDINNPLITNYDYTSVSIGWTSTEELSATITYELADGTGTEETLNAGPAYVHLFNLADLVPDTTYVFTITSGTDTYDGTFSTAPNPMPSYTPPFLQGTVGYYDQSNVFHRVEGAVVTIEASYAGQTSTMLAAATSSTGSFALDGMLFKDPADLMAFNDVYPSPNNLPDVFDATGPIDYEFTFNIYGGPYGELTEVHVQTLENSYFFGQFVLDGPPTPPINFTAVGGDQIVNLSWDYPLPTGNEVQFVVNYRPDGSTGPWDMITVPAGQTSYVDVPVTEYNGSDLVNNTTYRFELQVENDLGYLSLPPVVALATPFDNEGPAPVDNFDATPSETFVTLCWDNPDDLDFSGVVIYRTTTNCITEPTGSPLVIRDTGVFAQPGAEGLCYVDNNVQPDVTYYYTIFAFDDEAVRNYSTPECDSATPGDYFPPDPLKDFTATAILGTTDIEVTWGNPDSLDYMGALIVRKTGSPMDISYNGGTVTIDGFTFERQDVLTQGQILADDVVVLAVTDNMTNSVLDAGLEDGTIYYYAGFAFDEVPNYSTPETDEMMANPHPDLDIFNFGGNVTANVMNLTVEAGLNAEGSFILINPHRSDPDYNVDPDPFANEPLVNLQIPGGNIQLVNLSGNVLNGLVDDLPVGDFPGDVTHESTLQIPTTSNTIGGIYEGWVKVRALGKYSEQAVVDSFKAIVNVIGADEIIEITPDPITTTASDNVASGTFNVNNTGNADIYNLSVLKQGFPQSWVFQFDPQQIASLPYQGMQPVDFTIEIPANFLAGDYTGTIRVQGAGDGLPWDTAELTVTVPEAPSMSAIPNPLEITVDAGSNAQGMLTLQNTGNVQINNITFSGLTLTHTSGAVTLPIVIDNISEIVYGGSVQRFVSVQAPSDAIGGMYAGTVTATGNSGDVEAMFDVHVMVENATESLMIDETCDGTVLTNSGDPGETVEFQFCVVNDGNVSLDNVDVYAQNFGLDVTFSPDPVELPWNPTMEPVTVNAYITIPEGTEAGDYEGVFCARDDDNMPFDCADVVLTVNSTCGWAVDVSQFVYNVTPGVSYELPFDVCNTGNDVISGVNIPEPISFIGSDGFVILGDVDDYATTIEPGECISTTVMVDIDENQYSTTYTGTVEVQDGQCGGGTLNNLSFDLYLEVAPSLGWAITPGVVDFGDVDAPSTITLDDALTITNTSNCDITDLTVNTIQLQLEGCDYELTAEILLDETTIPYDESRTYDARITVPEEACAGMYSAVNNFQFEANACGDVLSNGTIGATAMVNADCDIEIVESSLMFEMDHGSSDTKTFTVANVGNNDLTISLAHSDLPASFTNVQYPANLFIEAGDQEIVEVTIYAPLGQYADTYNVTMTATAEGNCDAADIMGDVVVWPTTDIDFCSDGVSLSMAPGSSDNGQIRVVNPNSNANNCYNEDGPANEDLDNIMVTGLDGLETTANPVVAFQGTVEITEITMLESGNDMDLTVTANAANEEQAGTYSTVVTISGTGTESGNVVSDTFVLTVVVAWNPSMQLSGDLAFSGMPGETVNQTFTVTNTGNITLTNISLDDTFSPIYNVMFDHAAFTLQPTASAEVTATVVIPMPNQACAGTVDGQVNATSDQGATAFLASSITIEEHYDFDVMTPEGGLLTFVGSSADQPSTQDITIENTGNAQISGFTVSLKTPLRTVDGDEFPAGNVEFMNLGSVSIPCGPGESEHVTVEVTIPENQVSGTYVGSFEVMQAETTGSQVVNIEIEVRENAELTVSWSDMSGGGVEDGVRSKVGELTVTNTGNTHLDNVVVSMLGGDGLMLQGTSHIAIFANDVTFNPENFSLPIGESKTVEVWIAVPGKVLNGVYEGMVEVKDSATDTEQTATIHFTVSDSRDYSVGPNPVEFPDFREAEFRFKSGSVNEVRIYNMAADMVREATGLAGDSWTWDLMNDDGEEVASGMYLCLLMNGDTVQKEIKLLVIKTEE